MTSLKRKIVQVSSGVGKKKKQKKISPSPCPVIPEDFELTTDVFGPDETKEWKTHLNEKGWVVIRQALSDDDYDSMLLSWDKTIKGLNTGADLRDASTLVKSNLPGVASVGIFKDPSSGWAHSEPAYEARRLTKPYFSQIYDTEDLHTSFDGASLFPNWSLPGLEKSKTNSSWLHIDQGSTLKNERCVQGMLNLLPSDSTTGGLVVCEKTHLCHEELLSLHSNKKTNYLKMDFNNVRVKEIVKTSGISMVCAPRNSLILWDSRLIHSNHHALETPVSRCPVLRMNNYVCMMPKRSDEKTLVKRKAVLDNLVQTNHWTYMLHDKGPMKVEHMSYPRHKSFKKLTSVALPLQTILKKYNEML